MSGCCCHGGAAASTGISGDYIARNDLAPNPRIPMHPYAFVRLRSRPGTYQQCLHLIAGGVI